MVSPIGSDPLESFWNLGPWWDGAIAFLASPVAIYLIELTRSVFDKSRLPFGLAILRWPTVCLGDPLLAGIVATMAVYYQRIQVDPSPFTGLGFFVSCGVIGFLLSAGNIIFEKVTGGYPKGHEININRPYHFLYTAWMVYMLVGSLRSIAWVVVYRDELLLVVIALVLFGGHCITQAIERLGYNYIWQALERRYPERTRIP